MKEIEELVEWGAKHIPTGQKLNKQQVIAITEAILSHPDLAYKCPECKGSGIIYGPSDNPEECETCKGKGFMPLADALKEKK